MVSWKNGKVTVTLIDWAGSRLRSEGRRANTCTRVREPASHPQAGEAWRAGLASQVCVLLLLITTTALLCCTIPHQTRTAMCGAAWVARQQLVVDPCADDFL